MKSFEIYDANNSLNLDRDSKWPVIYILRDDKNMYIGETTNIYTRLYSHGKSKEKSDLNSKLIIRIERSNKSSACLIESDLINRAFADGTFTIINKKKQSNEALSGHDFFEKELVKTLLPEIWNSLRDMGIFKRDYYEIENDDLFKYSPWKDFNFNQLEIIDKINNCIINDEIALYKVVPEQEKHYSS